ncbi:DUF4937 domain-containing protein [Phytomonospora sp. NPDC050363]|uniref:DUF4937 domain-containing protein n=1 Tax=Phytomonospora sp. NPDC050363 TaxID=3155642 RepID=UPI00340DD2A4
MLVEWFRCEVTDRRAFESDRAAGERSRELPGFLGRCGGWDRDDPLLAHVFAFWTDRFSYHDFLAGADGELARRETCEKALVRTFMRRRDLPGGFQPRRRCAALLRVTYCALRDGRFGNVIERHNRMWEPRLAVASGMLGGFLAEERNTEVLVFSRWRERADHDAYCEEIVRRVRERPEPPPPEFATMERHLVDVVPDWTV